MKKPEQTARTGTNQLGTLNRVLDGTGRYWTGFDPECLKKKSGNGDKKRMDL